MKINARTLDRLKLALLVVVLTIAAIAAFWLASIVTDDIRRDIRSWWEYKTPTSQAEPVNGDATSFGSL